MGKETDIDGPYLQKVYFSYTIWNYLLCHSRSYQEIRLNWGRYSKASFTLMCSTLRFLPVLGLLKWGDGMINGTQKRVRPCEKLWLSVEKPNHPEGNLQEGVYSMPISIPRMGLGFAGEGWVDSRHIFFSPLVCLSEALPSLKCVSQSYRIKGLHST